ncbi:MAG: hypothetical protein HYU80_01100 [Candidatus Blackburnbacteria bacterium]|nr:hypothetical protein [Candidatus Blackburnbacteria bacterium]
MDPVRVLLFLVVTVLTGLLVGVGVQSFLILRDLRRTMAKFNKILDDVSVVSSSIARPVSGLAHLIDGLKNIKDIVDGMLEKKEKTVEVETFDTPLPRLSIEESFSTPLESSSSISALQERGRRFFHRDGKPLTS